jgi:hypothetical protein
MSKTKSEFVELLASGAYYVLQRHCDLNRDDISIKREDGSAAEIYNYPYRINQMPAYIFDELVRDGVLREDGKADCGGTVFRVNKKNSGAVMRAA